MIASLNINLFAYTLSKKGTKAFIRYSFKGYYNLPSRAGLALFLCCYPHIAVPNMYSVKQCGVRML